MRVVGYCIKCRRIKQITVRQPWIPGVPQGVCADCEEKERG